jgi:ubiquinone/menaquinone biosynthesis C-methylase UbiE
MLTIVISDKSLRIHNIEAPSLGARGGPNASADLRPNRIQRVYERIAPLYPVSSLLFHTAAHQRALNLAGLRDGSRVLEIAIGSGEFFQEICARNPQGQTIGVDFSFQMAAASLRAANPGGPPGVSCSASDARALPFCASAFDSVFVCFLLELLPDEAVKPALAEMYRVLRPGGRLALVMTGQNLGYFNLIYRQCTRFASSVWGRQLESRVPPMLDACGFRTLADERTWQNGFPARVMVLERPLAS